ncbi:MAG: hypothetical protein CM15mV12_0860 [uncultured marine virus]|nr:MAG: hypothetical protein CM15mV12_0860 [uncultured marine virus]
MILFEKIRWKNILSTGNHFTEVNLTDTSTTLIIGANGSGKSTVLDALTFSLFGKPFRKINKLQLLNSTNEKDGRVEVEFSINETQWKVIRGIKPNIFEIYRNGNVLDQFSAANDQQKWLEQNVIKMNYKSFTQIVILGSSSFIPFMQSSNHRREVIEDLLDIKIFSSMSNLIKEKIRSVKEELKVLQLKKESLNDKLKMQENFIEELENRSHKNIDERKVKINTLLEESDEYVKENVLTQKQVDKLTKEQEEVTGATEKLRDLGGLKGKISNKVSTITKEHKFFSDNTVCPTCTQPIKEEFRINKINDAQTKAKELQSGYKKLEKAIKNEENRERHLLNYLRRLLN